MKTLPILIAFLSFANAARANEVYACIHRVPRGTSELTILENQNGPTRVLFNFRNTGTNEVFWGALRVTDFEANDRIFDAVGIVRGNTDTAQSLDSRFARRCIVRQLRFQSRRARSLG